MLPLPDSVGHHLAGALEIPLLSLFTGHQDDHFPLPGLHKEAAISSSWLFPPQSDI